MNKLTSILIMSTLLFNVSLIKIANAQPPCWAVKQMMTERTVFATKEESEGFANYLKQNMKRCNLKGKPWIVISKTEKTTKSKVLDNFITQLAKGTIIAAYGIAKVVKDPENREWGGVLYTKAGSNIPAFATHPIKSKTKSAHRFDYAPAIREAQKNGGQWFATYHIHGFAVCGNESKTGGQKIESAYPGFSDGDLTNAKSRYQRFIAMKQYKRAKMFRSFVGGTDGKIYEYNPGTDENPRVIGVVPKMIKCFKPSAKTKKSS